MSLVWKSDWDTGIDTIDMQHRGIVNYINQLSHIVPDPKPKLPTLSGSEAAEAAHYASFFGALSTAEFSYALEEFIRYIEDHFNYEEQLHVEDTYQLAAPHKETHDLFLVRLKKYQEKNSRGEDNAEKLCRILNHWVEQHIPLDVDYIAAVKRSLLSNSA